MTPSLEAFKQAVWQTGLRSVTRADGHALEAHPAGVAELAVHRAADLRRHADGDALPLALQQIQQHVGSITWVSKDTHVEQRR